jgi:very-short-patch-repair endonuclease
MQHFTLINGAAGDRRLNVLFSRAKHGVTVFSSMRPDQIRVDASSPRGTRLLKDYLAFAATGRLDQGHTPYKECDSDFERFVKERLEAKGYEVVAQVGVAGFWIDLGVRHHEWPYGFLLGIECDGAAYHSSLSARDRDRLRQQILEGLGWTIYRVWSTDWFRDQNRELAKMVDFIERTLADRQKQQVQAEAEHVSFIEAVDVEELDEESPFPPANDEGENEEDEWEASEPGQRIVFDSEEPKTTMLLSVGANDYTASALATYVEATFDDLGLRLNKDRFFDVDYEETLAKLIDRCVSIEGPIRDDVLARRVGSLHGFGKAGSHIREHVASIARSLYKITREGNNIYFWPAGVDPATWHTFRCPRGDARPVDEIAIPELQALALLAMADRRSATEDVLLVMARIAGLQRLRAPSRERLALAHRKALAHTRLPSLVDMQ